jgi:hypothetical protein
MAVFNCRFTGISVKNPTVGGFFKRSNTGLPVWSMACYSHTQDFFPNMCLYA